MNKYDKQNLIILFLCLSPYLFVAISAVGHMQREYVGSYDAPVRSKTARVYCVRPKAIPPECRDLYELQISGENFEVDKALYESTEKGDVVGIDTYKDKFTGFSSQKLSTDKR